MNISMSTGIQHVSHLYCDHHLRSFFAVWGLFLHPGLSHSRLLTSRISWRYSFVAKFSRVRNWPDWGQTTR